MPLSDRMSERPGMERLAAALQSVGAPLCDSADTAARLCLLDTLGAGIYGAATGEAAALLPALTRMGGGDDALVWGTRCRAGTADAAFLCGSLAHLRELDDVHHTILHTGAVCVPAAMAVAQREGANLGEILAAVATGVEAAVRVAAGMDYLDHRARGFHGTATCGPFGAAAAAARLLGLDEMGVADAMGIAGSRTGGTWAFSADNALTKRLHPGFAARDGVLAAYLAASGVRGPRRVLEAADGGFYRYAARDWDLDALDAPRERLAIEEVEYKWYASCKSVHSPLSAARSIRVQSAPRPVEGICRIRVGVNASAYAMAARMYERDSVVSAQLSIPYGVALGLLGRSGGAEDYTPAAIADPAAHRLAGLAEVYVDGDMDELRRREHRSGAVLTVDWTDGESVCVRETKPKGSAAAPLGRADVAEKFGGLAAGVLGPGRAGALAELVLDGAACTDVSALCGLLQPEESADNGGVDGDAGTKRRFF